MIGWSSEVRVNRLGYLSVCSMLKAKSKSIKVEVKLTLPLRTSVSLTRRNSLSWLFNHKSQLHPCLPGQAETATVNNIFCLWSNRCSEHNVIASTKSEHCLVSIINHAILHIILMVFVINTFLKNNTLVFVVNHCASAHDLQLVKQHRWSCGHVFWVSFFCDFRQKSVL